MKKFLGFAIIVGACVAAWIIGGRMSTDAVAVVIGVLFGVAASIPTSMLVVAATRSMASTSRRPYEPFVRSRPPAPQIYVVTPGQVPSGKLRINSSDGWNVPAIGGPPPYAEREYTETDDIIDTDDYFFDD